MTSVFETGPLSRLAEDLGDASVAREFGHRYLRLLPGRVTRIVTSLREDDLDDALDATLSLKASSRAVGAGELAWLAELVEHGVRRVDAPAALEHVDCLLAACGRADTELGAYLAATG